MFQHISKFTHIRNYDGWIISYQYIRRKEKSDFFKPCPSEIGDSSFTDRLEVAPEGTAPSTLQL